MYPLDDEDLPLRFDLSPGLRTESIRTEAYLPCLQRTAEGAGQSAGSGGDDVIEGRGMGLGDVGGDPVVGSDRAMDAEQDRLRFGREIGPAKRPLDSLDPYL
jgi:hypothetical protein